MRICPLLALLLAWPLLAAAQTPVAPLVAGHPCDLPIPASVPSANTGEPIVLWWCHDGTDVDGVVSTLPLTWRIYRNDVLVTGGPVTKSATANAAGLFAYQHTRIEPVAGAYLFAVAAFNAAGEAPRVPFVLLPVTDPRPPAVPSPIVHPRIARP